MKKKKIIIIGAGPGGLTAGMILSHKGYDVIIYEKEDKPGGRNSFIKKGEYKFDIGPTFLMMRFILDEIFQLTERKSTDYLKFINLSPMYQLHFDDVKLNIYSEHEKTKKEIAQKFPGQEEGYDRFLKQEKIRFEKIKPCLEVPYSNFGKMLGYNLRKAFPYLSVTRSVYDVIGDYFTDEKLRLSFNFQTKYLGMSAWKCPGAFSIIPYVEHEFGIYHVIGGLTEISKAMANVISEDGGTINYNTSVKQIIVQNGDAKGVILENGEKDTADAVIINADFAYAMTHLFPKGIIRKYAKPKIEKMKFSCSTFMLYLGVDKLYKDIDFHNIIFAKDYRQNIIDIFEKKVLPKDMSFYIRNSSLYDSTVAPKDHSSLYVLVPVPNTKSTIDWQKEKNNVRNKIIQKIKSLPGMSDIEEHIKQEHIIIPDNWVDDYNVYFGATFNLAHNLGQMLYFRPRNRFEEVGKCYLVGGGTHPGSGLPTIYESGRISAELIDKDFK